MSKLFVIPPPFIIKTAELASVFEAEVDHHLQFAVRMFSGSLDLRISGRKAWKCIKIAFSPVRSIQICIFKTYIGFSDLRIL